MVNHGLFRALHTDRLCDTIRLLLFYGNMLTR